MSIGHKSFGRAQWMCLTVITAIGIAVAGCSSDVPSEDESPLESEAAEAADRDGDEETAESSSELSSSACENICNVGSTLGCAKFKGKAALFCGFGSIVACMAACSGKSCSSRTPPKCIPGARFQVPCCRRR
jgi:hypothetical protein